MAALTCVECGRVIDTAEGWADYGDCPICLECDTETNLLPGVEGGVLFAVRRDSIA